MRQPKATHWCALALASALGMLPACQTLPPPELSWTQRLGTLAALQRFEFSGRVSALRGEQARSAGIRWIQNGELADVSVLAPLGMGAVRVELDGAALRLRDARGNELDAGEAGEALRATLGFDPPLAELRYWLLGLPDTAQPSEQSLDEHQRLARLEQAGWTVQYLAYQPVAGQWLPQRLRLSRADWRLLLAISRWQLR